MNGKVLVIDIGGTYIKYGLIDDSFKITDQSKIATPHKSQEAFFTTIQFLYKKFKPQISGIALSAPGIIDIENGHWIIAGALRHLHNTQIVKEISKRCDDILVTIENDGNAAALCEAYIGNAKDSDSSVSLVFGTGIGGSLVKNRQIIRGNNLIAGEFGQLFIDFENDESYTVFGEKYSTIAIIKSVKETLNTENMNGELMMKLYKDGHRDVRNILDNWFRVIAKLCFNIDCFYNPGMICIGGGISMNPLFIIRIQEEVANIGKSINAFRFPCVVECLYHNDANLIGAYCAFVNQKNRELLLYNY